MADIRAAKDKKEFTEKLNYEVG